MIYEQLSIQREFADEQQWVKSSVSKRWMLRNVGIGKGRLGTQALATSAGNWEIPTSRPQPHSFQLPSCFQIRDDSRGKQLAC